VRVATALQSQPLGKMINPALAAAQGTLRSPAAEADLLITDAIGPIAAGPRDRWIVRLAADDPAVSYIGPFVIDRAHPLTEGVELAGVIWSAGEAETEAGRPVIMAGNITLVADGGLTDAGRELLVRIRPELSTLQDTPAWPILMTNLVQWRARQLPGVQMSSVRVGQSVGVSLPAGVENVELTTPGGARQTMRVDDRSVTIPADAPGVWRIAAGDLRYEFAANLLDSAESDLRTSSRGEWGTWSASGLLALQSSRVDWMLALAGLGLLAWHAWLLRGGREGGVRL
jgi:hypothetical protein